jgi:predicted aspartyl protease
MPGLAGTFDKEVGVIVQMGAAEAGGIRKAIDGSEEVSITRFPALVDTGASVTCISSDIIETLSLSPISKASIQAAGGVHSANVFLVDLTLIFGAESLVIPNTKVTDFSINDSSPFQALLGRDILSTGVFTMSFDGHFTLSH